MPKMKTHQGLAKRMKVTGGGKVRRFKAGAGHLMTTKNAKRRRRLRQGALVVGLQAKKIKRVIPS